jgi:hypothetical protein
MHAARRFSPFFCAGLFLITVIITIVAASNLAARSATGTLEGTVLDAHGNPLPGATVTIQTSYGTQPHVIHTDAKGHFVFPHFATGQYDLRAYHNGFYSAWIKRVPLRSTKNAPLSLRISASKL